METKHEKNYSHGNDEIVSNRTLRASEVNSRRGNSTKQARTICNKFKPGYNGTTKVDSNPLNQIGEVTMSNDTDTKLEVMQVQVDSNEKVINAGLAGHKAELEGYKLNVDGRFESALERMDANQKVAFERMDADRKIADARHEAAMDRMDAYQKAAFERMDADRKVADAKHDVAMERMDGNQIAIIGAFRAIIAEFKAVRTEMKEGNTSMKLWVIITLISTFVGGAGLVAAGFTIFRALSGN